MTTDPMKFLLLTYKDSVLGRIGVMLVKMTDLGLPEWSVVEGLPTPLPSALWDERCRGMLGVAADSDGRVHVRVLDLPDPEPISGDGDGFWERATEAYA